MTTTIAHTLEAQHALPHFAWVIGQRDWPRERTESALKDGQFYALGPEDMPSKYLSRFEEGGILPPGPGPHVGKNRIVPVPTTDNDLAALVVRMASDLPASKLFFREPYLELTDKTKFVDGLEQIDSALYSRIECHDLSQSSVIAAIRARSASWMSFLMIATKPFGESLSFSSLMTYAEMIGVAAYDGESYLFWTRRHSPHK